MAGIGEYKGIQYSIEPLGESHWRWHVSPPECVLGLRAQAGEVKGQQRDAIHAAQAAIQSQIHFSDARQAD